MSHNRERILDVPISMNKTRVVDVQGTRVATLLGPSQFPSNIRVGLTDEPSAMYFVEFIYYVDPNESTESTDGGQPGSRVFFGRHSGRLMRIEQDLPSSPKAARIKMDFDFVTIANESYRRQGLDPISKTPSQQEHLETLAAMMPWVTGKLEELRDRPSLV